MQIPARKLGRTSRRDGFLHIIDWRKDLNGAPPSLCGPPLARETGPADITTQVCPLCLTAEEMLRAGIVFTDIKVSRLAIGGMTIPQAMLAAVTEGAPGTAIITVHDGETVLQWYEASDEREREAS